MYNVFQLTYMENDNRPNKVLPKIDKDNKEEKDNHPLANVIVAIVFLLLGFAALLGWWNLESLFFKISLYIVAVFLISIAVFGIIDELTPGSRHNYSTGTMLLTWIAGLIYAYTLTNINALHWLYGILASIFGFFALIIISTQLNEDIRAKTKIGWTMASILIFGIYIGFGWSFALPGILLLVTLTSRR